jgi:ankyrin repeat protein
MDALAERQIEIMKFLLHHGADPRKTNHRGEDLYGLATRLNLSPYLREAGL